MEDRLTAGLYLEMTDLPVDRYASERVPEVVKVDGVERGSWWANVNRDRTDLPRVLPEFSLLGLYEVTPDFVPPPPGDGVSGLHFRRYPRPGQGSLHGTETNGLSVVLISPRHPEGAQALRDWGDFVHIRHIAEAGVPGYGMITPYEHADGGDPRFLHLYEMCTPDPEAAFRSMTPLVQQRLGCGPGSPEYDGWAFHPELRIMYVNSFRRLG